jgi:hypothetical protein
MLMKVFEMKAVTIFLSPVLSIGAHRLRSLAIFVGVQVLLDQLERDDFVRAGPHEEIIRQSTGSFVKALLAHFELPACRLKLLTLALSWYFSCK